MRPDDQLLCLCTRQDFIDQHKNLLREMLRSVTIDWQYVLETADQNQVAPLIYRNLQEFSGESNGVPAAILQQLKQRYMHNVIVKKRTAEISEVILSYLASRKIPGMLLKGAALDLVAYREPWYTCMADVDLVLRIRLDELSVIERNQIHAWFEQFNRHSDAYKVHIEYDFFSHHDMTMNGLIDIDPERTWQSARQLSFRGQLVWIMSPEDLLIASAINSCRKRYFRLKSALDVTTLIATHPELDWQEVTSKAQAYRCNTILYTCLTVTHAMLGTAIPNRVFSDLQVHPLRAKTIRFLVRTLLRRISLLKLSRVRTGKFLERQPGWGLILTYASYRLDQIIPKFTRLWQVNFAHRKLAHKTG